MATNDTGSASEISVLRKVLCRRLHEHDFTDQRCDGAGVVCGFCDHTARQMADAMLAERSKP